jgi:hypothetical protein
MKVSGNRPSKKYKKLKECQVPREERANMMHPLWWLQRVHLQRDSLRVKRQYVTGGLQREQSAHLAQGDEGGQCT